MKQVGDNMKIISIIIVTYFSDKFLEECINSIYLHNDLKKNEIEIIIVDNSQYTTKCLRGMRKKFADIKIISNPKNAGFGQGNNLGADIASGKILLFLNPDTKFIIPIFREIINIFKNDKTIGTVGCQLIDGKGVSIDTYGYFPEIYNLFLSIVDKYIFALMGYIPRKKIYPWGANLFIRRKDFFNIGKFDEKMFLCNEEPDLCRRILPKRTFIINKKLIHYGGHSMDDICSKFDFWLDSLEIYHKKYKLNLNKTLNNYIIIFIFKIIQMFLLGKNYLVHKKIYKKLILFKRKANKN